MYKIRSSAENRNRRRQHWKSRDQGGTHLDDQPAAARRPGADRRAAIPHPAGGESASAGTGGGSGWVGGFGKGGGLALF
jgi:hypothetical protein